MWSGFAKLPAALSIFVAAAEPMPRPLNECAGENVRGHFYLRRIAAQKHPYHDIPIGLPTRVAFNSHDASSFNISTVMLDPPATNKSASRVVPDDGVDDSADDGAGGAARARGLEPDGAQAHVRVGGPAALAGCVGHQQPGSASTRAPRLAFLLDDVPACLPIARRRRTAEDGREQAFQLRSCLDDSQASPLSESD